MPANNRAADDGLVVETFQKINDSLGNKLTKSEAASTYQPQANLDTAVAALVGTGAIKTNLDGTYVRSDSIATAVAPWVGKSIRLSSYCTGSGADESTGLQNAINAAITQGVMLLADVPGWIGCSSMVTLGDEVANSGQMTRLLVVGLLRVKALTAMDTLLRISGTTSVIGDIEADGVSLVNFSVYCKNYGRATLGRIHAWGGLVSGIAGEPSGNNNAWSVGKLRVRGSGQKLVTSATVSARSATSGWTSTGDSAPYTTWTLSSPLPDAMTSRTWAVPVALMGDGRVMQVRNVVDVNTIEIFNEDKAVGTTDTLTLATAAINFPYYGDVGVWDIGNVDVRDNPNAWSFNYGGYGGSISMFEQQNNLGGCLIMKKATGISFGAFYTEQSGTTSSGTPWLAVRDVVLTGLFIGPGTNAEPTNWQGISTSWMSMTGRNKQPLHWIMVKPSGSPLALPPAVPVDPPELTPGTRNITPGTTQAYRRTSGNYALRIDNNYTTGGVGLVTLACPTTGAGTTITLSLLTSSGGHTIEGSSTWAMTTVGTVTLCYWLEGTDWKVRTVGNPVDTLASISATPNRVGQVAVVSGVIYMAAGTSAASDWKQISN